MLSDLIELNRAGVGSVLRLPGHLQARGRRVAAAAGPGHEMSTSVGNRARVVVYPTTYAARRAEATDRKLTRAVDAARG